ncbi:enoyl-CoA-hydratase DpgB [Kitasatospora sp. NPDC056327]|uniref:enoyl-CoA-hydratase DpgB n=1 Tax=Kitasatospora sp. NPDC056327 TaxID=3345785 RepID=UPI0035D6B2BB
MTVRTEQEEHTTMTHSPEPALVDGSRPLSPGTVQALNALCDRAEDEGGHAPVVLRVAGAPGAPAPAPPLALVNKWERALRRLERLDRPTVALVGDAPWATDGTGTNEVGDTTGGTGGTDPAEAADHPAGSLGNDCGGTALEVLLATDYRIAPPTARLLLPVGPEGVWPGMALHRLVNQAGVAATRRAVLFGAALTAPDAVDLSLLDDLPDDPAAALAAVAGLLAAAAPGIAIRRQLMLDAATTPHEEALGRHLAACDRVLRRAAGAPAGTVA